jgi:hypothetical protein
LVIVDDRSTGALFAVAIIVKLVDETLHAQAFAYFPNCEREDAQVAMDA